MAPPQEWCANFSNRVCTFPLMSTNWWWGYLASHWALRLKLLVAIWSPLVLKLGDLCTSTSAVEARFNTAAVEIPWANTVGTSL